MPIILYWPVPIAVCSEPALEQGSNFSRSTFFSFQKTRAVYHSTSSLRFTSSLDVTHAIVRRPNVYDKDHVITPQSIMPTFRLRCRVSASTCDFAGMRLISRKHRHRRRQTLRLQTRANICFRAAVVVARSGMIGPRHMELHGRRCGDLLSFWRLFLRVRHNPTKSADSRVLSRSPPHLTRFSVSAPVKPRHTRPDSSSPGLLLEYLKDYDGSSSAYERSDE